MAKALLVGCSVAENRKGDSLALFAKGLIVANALLVGGSVAENRKGDSLARCCASGLFVCMRCLQTENAFCRLGPHRQ